METRESRWWFLRREVYYSYSFGRGRSCPTWSQKILTAKWIHGFTDKFFFIPLHAWYMPVVHITLHVVILNQRLESKRFSGGRRHSYFRLAYIYRAITWSLEPNISFSPLRGGRWRKVFLLTVGVYVHDNVVGEDELLLLLWLPRRNWPLVRVNILGGSVCRGNLGSGWSK